jgi:hypothetical protein
MASDLTPNSVSRLQKLASMTFYTGDVKAAEKLLDRATTIGLDSKMFDSQTLVILAFTRLDSKNRKGLQRCRDDFTRLLERSPGNPRLLRQVEVIEILGDLMADRSAEALARTRAMNQTAKEANFDFEACSNLASLCAQLGRRKLGQGVTGDIVEILAMRFCTNRSLTEMLAGSTQAHPGLPDRIREAGNQIMKISQDAVSLAMRGDPASAVQQLMIEGQTTLNAKLIETAYQLLLRYQSQVPDASTLSEAIEALRSRYSTRPNQAKKTNQTRQAGGLQFRASAMSA